MPKSPPQRRWMRLIGGLLYTLLLLFSILAGGVLGWIGESSVLSSILRQSIARTTPQEVFDGQIQNKDALNLLLLGCDEDRAPGGKKILRQYARSDMMLLTRLDFAHNRITGVSIPRDTLAELPGYRSMRINAFHSIGGKDLAKQAVEALLDVPIDKVVVLNYKAFQEMVDLVGGVDIYVNKPLKYTDRAGGLFINLKPGRQVLKGYDAMCFVRYRHGDSDYARQDRQKDFILSFKEAVMKKPGLIGTVADKAVDVLGGELDAREVAALALFARKIGNDNIRMGQIPVLDAGNFDLRVDTGHLRKTLRDFHFLDDQPTTVTYSR